MFKVGDYIKYKKRKFGVITSVHPNGYYGWVTHNGMKPRHNGAQEEDLKLITEEQFLAWVKRAGCTSMYEYTKLHDG